MSHLDPLKLSIEALNEEHVAFQVPLFDCCNNAEFSDLNRRQRDKIQIANQGMNSFVKDEAYDEQSSGLNRTSLLFYDDNLVGYVSLCADSIKLKEDELENAHLPYETVPAIKVARLAIHKTFHRKGLGKYLINYAVSRAFKTREFCGVKFLTVDCHDHRIEYYQYLDFVINGEQMIEGSSLTSLRLDIDSYLEKMNIED